MSFRQRRRNGLFRVSWGTCLLLSVLAHLFLLAGSCLVPEEWLASPRPAVSARMVKKVEPQLESRRQEPAEYLPAVVKTNEEQESATRPEVPKFQSNRNTRAEGGRKDPDGDRDMPAQDGVKRETGEIVLFNQERQDGDLSHERDGNKNASPGASSNVPYQPLEPSMRLPVIPVPWLILPSRRESQANRKRKKRPDKTSVMHRRRPCSFPMR